MNTIQNNNTFNPYINYSPITPTRAIEQKNNQTEQAIAETKKQDSTNYAKNQKTGRGKFLDILA